MQRLNYFYRLFVTNLLFVIFGLGGLLISLMAYPLFLIIFRNRNKRSQHGQFLIHLCFKAFIWLMKVLGVFSIELTGLKKLEEQGLFVISNHPTLIDVVILLSLLKNADCVVKAKLMENPFTKGPLKLAAYIINSEPEQLIDSCVFALNKNHNLVMFPEGTRTKNLNQLHFKRGAAKIAIKAKKNLVPIIIQCSPRMLGKNRKWYKVPQLKPHFKIKVGNKILVKEFLDNNVSENIQSRNLNKYIVNYFKEELQIA